MANFKKFRNNQLVIRVNDSKAKQLKFLVERSGKSFVDYMNNLIDNHLDRHLDDLDDMWEDL